MKKIILCTFAVLLINGCSKTPEEKVEDLFEKGVNQISEFQLKSADSTIAQIFDIDPGSMTGLLGVAKINDARLQYIDAIQNYSIILSNSTDYEDAFIGLYNSYEILGFYYEALEAAVHYNKIWHTNTHTKYILGEAYKNLGEIKRAEGYFEQAVKSEYEHKSAARFMLATTLLLQGLKEDASKEAALAIADKVENQIYYNAAAEYYEAVGLIDSAMQYNKKLFALNPYDIHYAFISFKRALKNNYLSDGRHIIQTIEGQQAEILVTQVFRLFYALHINDKSTLRTLSQLFRGYDVSSLTCRLYELYAQAELSDLMTLMRGLKEVEIEMSKGRYSDEFGEFLHHTLLMLSLKYEKNPSTISDFETITGLKKNRKEYKLELALNKYIIGSIDDSFNDLRIIESAHQTNASWLTSIAEVWCHPVVKQNDIAAETFQKALVIDPNYTPAFNSYLEMLGRIKKYDKALNLFVKYPQFEQNNFIALTKTKYFFLNKKYKEGLEQFNKFYQFAPGNIVLIKDLLEILDKDNQTDETKVLVNTLDINNPDIILLLANMEQKNNEYEKSLNSIDLILSIEPKNSEANILKARALYYTGKKTEAYDLFEKNLKEYKENAQNLCYYSEILANEGIDFPRASNMAREAVFSGYGAYPYLINLADIYYKMGRYDLCRGESIKATLIRADNPYPFFRLGMACINSKDQDQWLDKGKDNLRKAKKLGLSGDLLEEANKALKSK